MRTNDRLSLTLGVALALFGPLSTAGLTGCVADGSDSADATELPADEANVGEGEGAQNEKAPEFAAGQGQAKRPALPYPAAPYGVGVGSIIENLKFYGFPNAQALYEELGPEGAQDLFKNGSEDPAQPQLTSEQKLRARMKPIELAEFYNPTGAEDFPAGSAFTGKKPKVLLINFASVWCAPCNEEAKSVLPGRYAKYKPLGGEFLLTLADSGTPGEPATIRNLGAWTKKYKVDYPGTIDPAYKLDAYFSAPAFPSNFVIDTRTMKIRISLAGSPDSAFWKKFESIMNETP